MKHEADRARHVVSFTLIELLVVIAILSILMSMMLPALQKSRKVAQSVTCMNNLKQIGLAQMSYADDFGYYAAGKVEETCNFNLNWWFHKVRRYLGSNDVPTNWTDANNLGRIPPLWCPDTERAGTGTDTYSYAPNGFGYLKLSFGLSNCTPSDGDDSPYASHFIQPTSECPKIPVSNIMFISELGISTVSTNGYVHYCIRNGTYYNGTDGGTMPAFRHLAKKNVLFLDQHVEAVFQGQMEWQNYLQ